ncbi:endolytic transglycosylase MltG [Helicobacter sp. 13S00401-1]|uniref:endolytic transglycosylase MltG n=1 Tax=Helicobacter sp. 13S00401-1 TaxID=1905758 RepID=UPI00209BD241|nr:endolytic transglycosylase MltG [Helicobacter sp. 13S00401-1]
MSFYISYPMKSAVVLYIPKGTTKEIITQLKSQNYDVSKVDAYITRLFGFTQSGYIEMPSTTLTKGEFLYYLVKSKAATRKFTLIPGETSYFFLRDLASAYNLNIDKLEKLYNQKFPYTDGVILANTYYLPYTASEERLTDILLDTSMQEQKRLAIELTGSYNQKKWFKVITKASIIQKEAANTSEMPIISGVIDNRIKIGMPLQMDGSLNYGKYSHIRVTPERIQNDKTTFNTYKYLGLPKEPSGSVSIAAIKAALHPAKVPYLYFMRNDKGTHNFSTTYQAHLNNVEKRQKTLDITDKAR